jgi:hypothetical protein
MSDAEIIGLGEGEAIISAVGSFLIGEGGLQPQKTGELKMIEIVRSR